jgi:hypothetical protein
METEDDRDFTIEEIRQTIKSIHHKKAPGEDGITSRILMWTFERIPRLHYIRLLKERMLSQEVEEGQDYPLIKPGKDNCNDASKYRPISLLNIGGKVLEKLLINRIMHFLYSNDLLNQNQFGFSPQKKHYRRGNGNKGLHRRSTHKRANCNFG